MPSRLFSTLEILTVGFPFCAFKILTGLIVFSMSFGAVPGAALIALGTIDACLNTANLLAIVSGKNERIVSACVLHRVTKAIRPSDKAWEELGLSLDTMLSFALVAIVIGCGLLPRLSKTALSVWSIAVVLNVLGAGLGRLAESLRRL